MLAMSRGVVFSITLRIILGPASCEKYTDMDFQIHCMETEAYDAVLRAFIAQSEVLSWGKELFITDLRKELRVSDVEHREILGKLNSDDSIKSTREQRKSIDGRQLTVMNPSVSIPMFEGHESHEESKPVQMLAAFSPKYSPHAQTSQMHARNERVIGKKTVFPSQVHFRQPVNPVFQKRQAPSPCKAGVSQIGKKGFVRSYSENIKPGSDIHAMDKHMNEVENTFGGVDPHPVQVDRANLVFRAHERALMDAIGKLTNASDDDDIPGRRKKRHQHCNVEWGRNIQ